MTFSGGFVKPFRPVFDPGLAARNGLLNALIAYWPGNEASGNLLDAHTNALHLTDTNTVTNAVGKVYVTARQYTAATLEYHTRTGDDALLSTGAVDFSLAAWVYKTSSGTRFVASKDNGNTQREYMLVSLDAGMAFACTPGNVYTPANAPAISLNEWHLVVGWRNTALAKIYIQVDGGTVYDADCAAPSDSTALFRVGFVNYVSTAYWDGRIGPVAFWKSAAGGGGVLTAAQRTALWNGGAGLAYAQFTT